MHRKKPRKKKQVKTLPRVVNIKLSISIGAVPKFYLYLETTNGVLEDPFIVTTDGGEVLNAYLTKLKKYNLKTDFKLIGRVKAVTK